MRAAMTAAALTVLYIVLAVTAPPLASGIGLFYLWAVAILVVPPAVRRWHHGRRT